MGFSWGIWGGLERAAVVDERRRRGQLLLGRELIHRPVDPLLWGGDGGGREQVAGVLGGHFHPLQGDGVAQGEPAPLPAYPLAVHLIGGEQGFEPPLVLGQGLLFGGAVVIEDAPCLPLLAFLTHRFTTNRGWLTFRGLSGGPFT